MTSYHADPHANTPVRLSTKKHSDQYKITKAEFSLRDTKIKLNIKEAENLIHIFYLDRLYQGNIWLPADQKKKKKEKVIERERETPSQ